MSDIAQDKSQGQQALEQLQEVYTRIASARTALKTTLASIGGVTRGAQATPELGIGEGATAEGRPETRFFPALNALTLELDREVAGIEVDIKELARRF